MTTTILAVLALTGSLVPQPQVQTDYGQALLRAATEKKPMAVLIGKGDAFAKLMADSKLSGDAKKLLAEKFVCVSVDVNTDGGKALAGQFQLTDGLVISSAGGSHQALRQAGEVTATDLAKHTAAYANTAATPVTTVTAGAPAVSVAAPYTVYPAGYTPVLGGCATGNCPTTTTFQPATYAPVYSGCTSGNCPTATFQPATGYTIPSASFVGSSCPNGRCPNVTPTYIR